MSSFGAVAPLIPECINIASGTISGEVQLFGKMQISNGVIGPTTIVGELVAPLINAGNINVTSTLTTNILATTGFTATSATFGLITATSAVITGPASVSGPATFTQITTTTDIVSGPLRHSGAFLGVYGSTPVIQATSSIVPSPAVTTAAGAGGAMNIDSTFNGYTLSQIVFSLQRVGVLD